MNIKNKKIVATLGFLGAASLGLAGCSGSTQTVDEACGFVEEGLSAFSASMSLDDSTSSPDDVIATAKGAIGETTKQVTNSEVKKAWDPTAKAMDSTLDGLLKLSTTAEEDFTEAEWNSFMETYQNLETSFTDLVGVCPGVSDVSGISDSGTDEVDETVVFEEGDGVEVETFEESAESGE